MINIIKKDWTILLCLLTGLLLRVLYIIRYPIQPRDAYSYMNVITKWEKEGFIEDGIGIVPLSLWILKTPHKLFSIDLLKGGVVINMILGLLIIVVMIRITGAIFHNELIQLFVGLITATHPILIHFSCVFLRENSYLFFSGLALFCLVKYLASPRYLYLSCGSVASSLSFACRLEGLELPLFFFSAILFGNRYKKKTKRFSLAIFVYVLVYIFTLLMLLEMMGINSNNIHYIKTKIKARTVERIND